MCEPCVCHASRKTECKKKETMKHVMMMTNILVGVFLVHFCKLKFELEQVCIYFHFFTFGFRPKIVLLKNCDQIQVSGPIGEDSEVCMGCSRQ